MLPEPEDAPPGAPALSPDPGVLVELLAVSPELVPPAEAVDEPDPPAVLLRPDRLSVL